MSDADPKNDISDVSEPKEESAPKKVAEESAPAAKRVAKKTTPKKNTEPNTEKVEAPSKTKKTIDNKINIVLIPNRQVSIKNTGNNI